MNKFKIFNIFLLLLALSLWACIENDFPLPVVKVNVIDFCVDGQISNAEINNNDDEKSIYVEVGDYVNLQKLQITAFEVSSAEKPGVTIEVVDKSLCESAENFPTKPFASLDEIEGKNSRVDFSKGAVDFILRTYQDYKCSVTVKQVFERDIQVKQQYGITRFDEANRIATIDVPRGTNLSKIDVVKFDLCGKCDPDPTGKVWDFTKDNEFNVTYKWEGATPVKWTVKFNEVESKNVISIDLENGFNAHATKLYFKGLAMKSFNQIELDLKKESETDWTTVKKDGEIAFKDEKNFESSIEKLSPSTKYNLRFRVDGNDDLALDFETAPIIALENGGFNDWFQDKSPQGLSFWAPRKSGSQKYWDTGNIAAIIIQGNVFPEESMRVGNKGYSCKLQTRNAFLKIAAGSIYTGDFEQINLGGHLTFGRDFTSYPTKLKVNYKYGLETTQNYVNDASDEDSCHIYIALTDKQIIIENWQTDQSEWKLFNKYAPEIIAYAEEIAKYGDLNGDWITKELELKY
ncbi:MAG: PCMD domain-containing protein, partial [Bacteroidales bacterium]|nr:PCMD domain-containing protein [Bacteroidales bacterium]